MLELRFIYRDAAGEMSHRALARFSESGHYVTGFDHAAGHVCTFRKDRVVEYLNGCEVLLATPFAPPPPRVEGRSGVVRRPPDLRPHILFTGFPAVQRAHLEAQCEPAGLRVVKTVTVGLAFLCAGPTAGPSKVAKARAQGTYIVREPELHALLETGELPDYALDDGL